MSKDSKKKEVEVIPLFGRDEMNLVEFPFGPVTTGNLKTFEVVHEAFDRQLKRFVNRKLLITGSDAFGLPRPIDDQVLVGMKALTYEMGFSSRRVKFSRYQLCRTIGWPISGRSYQRLEESLDRIAGTTLKFKDAWWDKGEMEWKSKTFHLIESAELCSRDRFDRARLKNRSGSQQLCEFVWSEELWKSFSDGYIKSVDMEMFRRISKGRRREVPLRLYRVLDKRFYKKQVVKMELRNLCTGILGLSEKYCPSEMSRVLERAASCLIDCGFISEMKIQPDKNGELEAVFRKKSSDALVLAGTKKQVPEVASKREILIQFENLEPGRRDSLLHDALDYCDQHEPTIAEGYRRNQDREGEAKRGYLEMLLTAYLKNTRAKNVA